MRLFLLLSVLLQGTAAEKLTKEQAEKSILLTTEGGDGASVAEGAEPKAGNFDCKAKEDDDKVKVSWKAALIGSEAIIPKDKKGDLGTLPIASKCAS